MVKIEESKIQPQYQSNDDGVYTGYRRYLLDLYNNLEWYQKELPQYTPANNKRDLALQSLVMKDPILSGVLSTVISRDKNREWSITGSARQVSKYSNIMTNLNGGRGWRDFIGKLSTSFYSTNMGFVAEIGVDSTGVPAMMWSFDPTEVLRTGDHYSPIKYHGGSEEVILQEQDIVYANSMTSIISSHYGLGRCAVERSIDTAKLAIGVYAHDLEKLGAAPPKGILLGKGINRIEFGEAVEQAKRAMASQEREVYSNILSIFADNPQADLNVLPFSTLPDNFNFKDYIEFIVQIYALEFNVLASTIWSSIHSSDFNQSHQMSFDTQQTSMTGDKEFSASLKEEISRKFMPSSLEFEFERRNVLDDVQQLDVETTKLDNIIKMSSSGLISIEQAQVLLAENGFIKKEWVEGEEETTTLEIRQIRDSLLSNPAFVRRASIMPNEPILKFRYNVRSDMIRSSKSLSALTSQYDFPKGHVDVIADSSHDFIKNKYY